MGIFAKSARAPDDTKFQELILFIAKKSEGDKRFGRTKLNKLLFYSDFIAYKVLGRAITWHQYQKLPQGPAPRALMPVLTRMKEEELLTEVQREYHGMTQMRAVAMREPNLSQFSGEEINLVCELIDEWWNRNASQMSEDSHDFVGWQLAGMNETIPYSVALVESGSPPDEQDARIVSRIKKEAEDCLAR